MHKQIAVHLCHLRAKQISSAAVEDVDDLRDF